MASSAISGRSRHLLLGLVVVALLDVARASAQPAPEPEPAGGDEGQRAQDLAQQGFAAYDRKEYAAAIALFERAHQIDPRAGLLYNIAQAFRQIGPSGCDEALAYYRRYLAERTPADDASLPEGAVKARIVEMETCIATAADAAEPPPSSAPPPAPIADPTVQRDTPAAPGGDGDGRRLAGWIVAGGAAGALAVAAVTGGLAVRRGSELADDCPRDVCPSDRRDEVQKYDRLRVTAFVAGGVAVVAGGVAVWLLATAPASPSRDAVAQGGLTPWVAADGAGLLVRSTF